VSLSFPGGAGVLAARSVVRVEEVHWLDLGIPEALWVLEVRKLAPLLVAIDLKGGDLYEEAAARAQRILRELKAERRPLKP
jgi:tartrate dehydratase beta subunit/fumarate hydratase class I family protein